MEEVKRGLVAELQRVQRSQDDRRDGVMKVKDRDREESGG